ncbi:MAG TPA: erythromycin esterase family protein [Gemmatimonadales bacterium]|nr:erythromycin esterase family protein [Gemmatimonadales bacterium]
MAVHGLLLTGTPLLAQRPLNLDFETPAVAYPDRPWGWSLGWSAFGGGPAVGFLLDSTTVKRGRTSLRISAPDSSPAPDPQPLLLQLPAAFALGRTVTLTGFGRSGGGSARGRVTLEAWKDQAFAAADTAWIAAQSPRGNAAGWTPFALRIAVPDAGVHSVVVGVALEGTGSAWFDGFTLAVDGNPLDALPSAAAPPTAAELAWLGAHAAPLTSAELREPAAPGAPDLRLFGDIIAGAEVVGLGESTHGTREFFLVKHRLVTWMVRKLGFRVFAIEANQLAVERLNQYVQGGPGTARDAMRVMFRVWNTEGMLQLVEWLRGWNAAHPDQAVRFLGYDMQDHRAPADTLRAFLARTDPSRLPDFDRLAGEYRSQAASIVPQVADSVRRRWAEQAESLWIATAGQRAPWLAAAATRADSLAVEWAVQGANLLRQAARFNATLNSPERDSLMAANLLWARSVLAPGARTAVWAHDVHVSRGGDSTLSFNGGAQMGAYLSAALGDRYRAVSLLTFDGAYTATRGFSDHQMIQAAAFPAPAGSLEAALHALPRPDSTVGWIVDLRPARRDPAASWLRMPRPIRHIGYATYDYGFELSASLPLEFDGVVFIDHTGPSHLLP